LVQQLVDLLARCSFLSLYNLSLYNPSLYIPMLVYFLGMSRVGNRTEQKGDGRQPHLRDYDQIHDDLIHR
jgi:hypothetical protein